MTAKRNLRVEHRVEDVLDDLWQVLAFHGYVLTKGRPGNIVRLHRNEPGATSVDLEQIDPRPRRDSPAQLSREHRIDDVIEDLRMTLAHHAHALVQGDFRGSKILVLAKIDGPEKRPVAQIGRIHPVDGADYRTISGAIEAPSNTTRRLQ